MEDAESDNSPEADSGAGRLRFEEARVLGCLLEKEATTPDYYPMTVNALVNACNQKNNREPVTAFDPTTVEAALRGLRDKHFAARVAEAGARATKYRHTVDRAIEGIEPEETALLCVLLLRGPQTVGELRGRSERLHSFRDLASVETALSGMKNNFPEPLVTGLSPSGGRKVPTWAHLLCGEVEVPEAPADAPVRVPVPAPEPVAPPDAGRVEALEAEVAELKRELADLRAAFDGFRDQFG